MTVSFEFSLCRYPVVCRPDTSPDVSGSQSARLAAPVVAHANRHYAASMCTMARLAAFCLVTSCVGAGAATTGEDCAGAAVLRIEDASLVSASVVPASVDRPEYSRVLGVIRTAINFEMKQGCADRRGRWIRPAAGPGNLGRARRRARCDSQCPHWFGRRRGVEPARVSPLRVRRLRTLKTHH